MEAASPEIAWTFDPTQIVPIVLLGLLYARRARTLARRGTPVPGRRVWLFGSSLVVLLAALVSPVDSLGEESFLFMHMVQHVLLGDLAPLAFVAGLTGPMLRPVLALPVLGRLRVLGHPLVALPLWAVDLYAWHLPFMYEAALHDDAVHALEHVCFFVCGALMWAAVLELLPGPEWFGTGAKIGAVVFVRLLELVLANVFLWSSSPFYSTYRHAALWGISPAQDQSYGGAVMMAEGGLVTLVALAWLVLRFADESEVRQRLLERGLDPRAVRRAVRYGRAQELPGAR